MKWKRNEDALLTHLINERLHGVSHLECSLNDANVQHVAPSHLDVLHFELHVLCTKEISSAV